MPNQGCQALYDLFNSCNNNPANVLSDVANNNLTNFLNNELSTPKDNFVGVKNDIFDVYKSFCIFNDRHSNPDYNANAEPLFKQRIYYHNKSTDDWFDQQIVDIYGIEDVEYNKLLAKQTNEKLPLNHDFDSDQMMSQLGEDFNLEIKICVIW